MSRKITLCHDGSCPAYKKSMESKGRVGLFELMEMTVAVTVLIITKPSSIATKKSAITQNGFKTMRQEGLTKAAGTTNVGVVFRATQEADGI